MAITPAWQIDESTDVLTVAFQKWVFPDLASEFVVINDDDPAASSVVIHISFDGTNTHFKLNPGEFKPWIAERKKFKECIWIKYVGAAAPDYRGMSTPRD